MGEKSKFIDITGQTFNHLTAIKCLNRKKRLWEFKCSCGKICTGNKSDVTSGRKKSCGHICNRGGVTTKPGDKFGEWEVLYKIDSLNYYCRCSCGKEKKVHHYDLRTGKSKSCGHGYFGSGVNGRKNMEGTKVGEWSIGKYVGNSKYECTCSCGTKKLLAGTYLRTRQSMSCGCISNKFNDMTGEVYGKWTVIEFLGDYNWRCRCECGNESIVQRSDLLNGYSTCCGKCSFKDLTNKKFGMLNPLEYLGDGLWKCKCDCGNIKNILAGNIMSGSTKSCGCLRDLKEEKILKLIRESIEDFKNSNTDLPFVEDIAEITGLVTATINKYANKYEFKNCFNLKFGSRLERDIYNIIKEFIDEKEIKLHDREILKPREVDIYIPSKKLGIEVNGNYWHSTEKVDKYYHREKSINAMRKGIHIINIFEYEWYDLSLRNKIIQLIKSRIISKTKIYARNTEVREIDKNISKEFLDKYHLQGYAESKVNIGCYYKNELVSVITFSKPRFNNNFEWEVVRYCTKDGIALVGGAEKMFSMFKKKYKPYSIITYSDLSKFKVTVYSKLGFSVDGKNFITEPNYIWYNIVNSEVLQRYKTQKSRLLELGLGKEEQTEEEIMKSLNFIQIFNSGNIRMIWRK